MQLSVGKVIQSIAEAGRNIIDRDHRQGYRSEVKVTAKNGEEVSIPLPTGLRGLETGGSESHVGYLVHGGPIWSTGLTMPRPADQQEATAQGQQISDRVWKPIDIQE